MPDYVAEVVIYTTGYCGFCHAAKRLLDSKGVTYRDVAVDQRPELRTWLREESGQHTVPQVFINGESIGGFTELRGLEMRGQLEGKLTSPPQGDNAPLPS